MINRRLLGVALFLAAGCATQPPKASLSSSGNNIHKIGALPEPRWETASGEHPPETAAAPEMVAGMAQEFARSQKGTAAIGSVDAANGTPELSPAPPRQNRPRAPKIDRVTSEDAGASTGDPATMAGLGANPVVNESAISKPGSIFSNIDTALPPGESARLAGAGLSSRASRLSNGPEVVPLSEDYSTTGGVGNPLAQRLMKRVRENPRDLAAQLDLQLFCMLNDNQSPELAAMSQMPDEDRELVSVLVDGLSNFRSIVKQDANMLPAQRMKPLQEMIERLRSQSELTVSTIALCKRVDAFGKYDPIVPARLPAMKASRVIVYCEVENFLPRQNASQMWETNLTEQVTLFTDTGLVVLSDQKRKVNDECRNRRHDFFAFNIINLPDNLTMGHYVLKVTINDDNADRVAEATVPVSVTGQ